MFYAKVIFITPAVVNCGHLELPFHTQYVSMEGSVFSQTVSVQCLPGFEPEEIFELICGADGIWNGVLPNCTACERLKNNCAYWENLYKPYWTFKKVENEEINHY